MPPHPAWNLFEGGRANLSATIKAYFALKLAGVPVDDPAMVSASGIFPAMANAIPALRCLFAGGRTSGAAVERGIRYLLETQRRDGSWEDRYWNSTGFLRSYKT